MATASATIDFATAFARLLSDSECRRLFREDRDELARRLTVNEADLATFLALDASALERQATGLIEKRMREVSRRIPLSWNRLGSDNAGQLFRTYSSSFWPTGHRRHVDDALSFGRWLLARGSREVCQAELNQLTFSVNSKPFAMRLVRQAIIAGRSRRAFQLLYRWRGKARSLFLYLRT